MKLTFTSIKDDYQQIKDIQLKWRNYDIKKEQKNEIKRLQLTHVESQNLEFQLPDVFITTRQFHSKPSKSPKIKKKTSFSFDLSVNSLRLTKQQRNTQITSMEQNYNQFKQLCTSIKSSPQKEVLSQSIQVSKNQVFYKLDGYKFPFSLYQIHKKRRDKMDDLHRNQTCDNSNQKIKQYEEKEEKKSKEQQKLNRKKEYTSRSFLDNAYFSILSANNECKYRIRKILQYSQPKNSRFSQF